MKSQKAENRPSAEYTYVSTYLEKTNYTVTVYSIIVHDF